MNIHVRFSVCRLHFITDSPWYVSSGDKNVLGRHPSVLFRKKMHEWTEIGVVRAKIAQTGQIVRNLIVGLLLLLMHSCAA